MEKSERERVAALTTSTKPTTSNTSGKEDLVGADRIKELHRVIAELERQIRELKSQADDNIDRINVIMAFDIILFVYFFIFRGSRHSSA